MKVLKYSGVVLYGLLFAAIAYTPSIADSHVGMHSALTISWLSLITLVVSTVAYCGYIQLSEQWQHRLLVAALLLLITVQILVALNFVDYGRADSFFVRNQAMRLAQGSRVWNAYFQVYSNNVNEVYFEASLIKGLKLLGLHSPWVSLSLIQFAWIDTGLWAGLKLLRVWHHARGQILLVIGWLVAVPVYAYALFIYSDPLVMPVPLIAAWLWISGQQAKSGRRQIRFWLLALLLAFAVAIKANTVVYLMALGLLAGVQVIKKQVSWRSFAGLLIKLGIALLIMIGLSHLAGQVYGYHKQVNRTLPATSWIAMALNPRTVGTYNYADAHAQMVLPTHQAKVRSEEWLIAHRLRRMGLTGVIKHTAIKAGIFLTAGTFDSLKLTSQWQKQPIWYVGHSQVISATVKIICQVFYGMTILSGLFFWLGDRPRPGNQFLVLAALGLAMFHILFWEVEPRYALPLLPIFLLWGTVGLMQLSECVAGRVRQRLLVTIVTVGVGLASLSGHSNAVYANTESNHPIVAEQGDGRYFSSEYLHLSQGKHLRSQIVVRTNSSSLTLVSRLKSRSLARIELSMNGKKIRSVVRSGQRAIRITYPTQAAGVLTVRITSIGIQSFTVGDVSTSYPVDRYHVVGRPHHYLRYYVRATQTM